MWDNVKQEQEKVKATLGAAVTANASPSSFQLTLESPEVKAKVAEYEAALRAAGEERPGVVGVVFAVNGKVTGAEVYGSSALFRKAWPKLLNSAAVEAIAERADAPASAPTVQEVEHFLAHGPQAEPAEASPDRNLTAASEWFRQRQPRGVYSEDGFQTQTRAGQFVVGGAVNSDAGLNQTDGLLQQAAGRIVIEGNTVTRNRAVLFDPVGNTAPNANPVNPSAPVQDNVIMGGNGAARPAAPANAAGNRLDNNYVENKSTLMVESRDPARGNAVIHKSYVKK